MSPTYLNPQTLDDLREIAKIVLRSMPPNTSLEQCMHCMAICASYGFSVWRAAELTQIIGGKPGPNAKMSRALVLRSNPKIETLCESPERVAIRVTRGENSHTADWTMQRAIAAGYVSKNANYKTVPQSMLAGRCWTEIGSRLFADVDGAIDDGDFAVPVTDAEVAAATTEAAEAPAAPPATGRFQPRFSAPEPTPPQVDYREALKPHTQLLRLADLPAEERRTLGAALLAAATPALVAELDDPATSDDTRRALLCSAMGSTPEQEAIMLPRVKPDASLLDAIRLAVDAAAVISDAPALDTYLASLDATGAAALWAAIEADAHTAAGALPGITTAPKRSKKGE